jgi:hypothetical protein
MIEPCPRTRLVYQVAGVAAFTLYIWFEVWLFDKARPMGGQGLVFLITFVFAVLVAWPRGVAVPAGARLTESSSRGVGMRPPTRPAALAFSPLGPGESRPLSDPAPEWSKAQ